MPRIPSPKAEDAGHTGAARRLPTPRVGHSAAMVMSIEPASVRAGVASVTMTTLASHDSPTRPPLSQTVAVDPLFDGARAPVPIARSLPVAAPSVVRVTVHVADEMLSPLASSNASE